MKKKEISSLKKDELKSKLDELKKELIKEKSQASNPRNPGKMRLIKKNIARILTAINKEVKQNK